MEIDIYKRYRNYSCITYMTEEQLKRMLHIYRKDIQHYAYAFHDKDDNEPHFHVIILWYNAITMTACKRRFGRFTDQNTFAEVLEDRGKCYEYLTHKNDKDKFHYDISIVKADNHSYWQACCYGENETDEKAVLIVADLMNGVPLSTMLKRYGREFVINYEKYALFTRLIERESNNEVHIVSEDGEIIK